MAKFLDETGLQQYTNLVQTMADGETIEYGLTLEQQVKKLSVMLQETRAAMGLGNTLGALPVDCGGTGTADLSNFLEELINETVYNTEIYSVKWSFPNGDSSASSPDLENIPLGLYYPVQCVISAQNLSTGSSYNHLDLVPFGSLAPTKTGTHLSNNKTIAYNNDSPLDNTRPKLDELSELLPLTINYTSPYSYIVDDMLFKIIQSGASKQIVVGSTGTSSVSPELVSGTSVATFDSFTLEMKLKKWNDSFPFSMRG